MEYFVDFHVNPKQLSAKELWDEWEKETEAALQAMEAGVIKAVFKVVGQRRVIAVLEIDSHDDLDRIIMGRLPLAHFLEVAEIVPVRSYPSFAEDVGRRWAE